LIGGGGERVTLRITAEHADYWHGFGDVSTWSRKSAVLDDWCRRVGRDPAAITRSCSVSGGDARAAERYAEAGAGLLIYGLGHPYDLGAVRELLSWRDAHNRR
jgi:alkanesulfonate monooxygenase SsuD/methylene tetrahydromethanopterin reductase-like flavin-dependent oxidoreductase (luciferase family)